MPETTSSLPGSFAHTPYSFESSRHHTKPTSGSPSALYCKDADTPGTTPGSDSNRALTVTVDKDLQIHTARDQLRHFFQQTMSLDEADAVITKILNPIKYADSNAFRENLLKRLDANNMLQIPAFKNLIKAVAFDCRICETSLTQLAQRLHYLESENLFELNIQLLSRPHIDHYLKESAKLILAATLQSKKYNDYSILDQAIYDCRKNTKNLLNKQYELGLLYTAQTSKDGLKGQLPDNTYFNVIDRYNGHNSPFRAHRQPLQWPAAVATLLINSGEDQVNDSLDAAPDISDALRFRLSLNLAKKSLFDDLTKLQSTDVYFLTLELSNFILNETVFDNEKVPAMENIIPSLDMAKIKNAGLEPVFQTNHIEQPIYLSRRFKAKMLNSSFDAHLAYVKNTYQDKKIYLRIFFCDASSQSVWHAASDFNCDSNPFQIGKGSPEHPTILPFEYQQLLTSASFKSFGLKGNGADITYDSNNQFQSFDRGAMIILGALPTNHISFADRMADASDSEPDSLVHNEVVLAENALLVNDTRKETYSATMFGKTYIHTIEYNITCNDENFSGRKFNRLTVKDKDGRFIKTVYEEPNSIQTSFGIHETKVRVNQTSS